VETQGDLRSKSLGRNQRGRTKVRDFPPPEYASHFLCRPPTSRQSSKKVRVLMGGPGGLGPPGGGVAGAAPPVRGVPEAVGCRQGGDFPPLNPALIHGLYVDCLLVNSIFCFKP
jgi:hypothetical protein